MIFSRFQFVQFFYKNFRETHAWQVWQAGIRHLKTHIDPKYFNMEHNEPVGFVGFISPFYYIGESKITKPTPAFSAGNVRTPDHNIFIVKDQKLQQIVV